MKILKKILLVIVAVVVLLIVTFGIYLYIHRQGNIKTFEAGNKNAKHHLLIASQGSDFKNMLVDGLVQNLKEKQLYIKVVDVTNLSAIDENEWDAMVFIHTTEKNELQPDVKKYLTRAKNLNKVILITTSGFGNWRTKDYKVDTITSASKKEELETLVSEILKRLDSIMENIES